MNDYAAMAKEARRVRIFDAEAQHIAGMRRGLAGAEQKRVLQTVL